MEYKLNWIERGNVYVANAIVKDTAATVIIVTLVKIEKSHWDINIMDIYKTSYSSDISIGAVMTQAERLYKDILLDLLKYFLL